MKRRFEPASVVAASSPDDEFEQARLARRRRIRTWMIAGGATAVAVALVVVIRARAWKPAPAKPAPGSIYWRLSVFSGNRVEFRPTGSLTVQPRHRDAAG